MAGLQISGSLKMERSQIAGTTVAVTSIIVGLTMIKVVLSKK